MSSLPPPIVLEDKTDAEHLNLLSIFHFVGAGLAALGLLFLLAHFSIMNTVMNRPEMWAQKSGPPPAEIFGMMKWFYLAGGIFFVASGVLNVISGLFS